jgi:hypothetical protein
MQDLRRPAAGEVGDERRVGTTFERGTLNESLYKKTETRSVTIPPPLAEQVAEVIRRNMSVTTQLLLAARDAGLHRSNYRKELTDGLQSVSGGDGTHASAMAEEWR